MFSQLPKLFLSATSTTLMILGLSATAANAVTFKFEGNRIKGSYTIQDSFYQEWVSAYSSRPEFTLFRVGAITDFKLFIDNQEVDYRDTLNGSQILATGYYDDVYSYEYSDLILRTNGKYLGMAFETAEGTLKDCITPGKVCTGGVGIDDSVLGKKFSEDITHSVVAGSSSLIAISSNQQIGNSLIFEGAESGLWYNNELAEGSTYGFEVEMTGDSLFNKLSSLPIALGDGNIFTVSVGEKIIGQVGSGQNLDINFLSSLGSGVSKFKVTATKPFKLSDTQAFPLQLGFDTEKANFKITALSETEPAPPKKVPEPTSSVAFLLLGLAGVLTVKSRFNPSEAKSFND